MSEYGKLLPTPSTKDCSGGAVEAIETENGFKRVSKSGISHGAQLHDVMKSLLPTPRATDGEHGGPNQRDSKGAPALAMAISTSSPAVSPASPSPVPGSERERTTTVTSGRRCFASYEKFARHGSSLRTLAASLLLGTGWYSRTVALTWRRKGTRFNRLLFQLAPSTRRTEGTGCGLLLTPTANENEQDLEKFRKRMEKYPNGTTMPSLSNQIAMLTTPNCLDTGNTAHLRPSRIATGRKTDYLSRQIAMLPTPTQGGFDDTNERALKKHQLHAVVAQMLPTPATRDYKGARKPETMALTGRNPMTNTTEDALVGTSLGLKLQPAFVEWMMGYPEGWTELTG